MIGIYKITNKLNGKSYIGQSIHCGKRLDEHCRGEQLIDEIIQLEGIENFNFEILKSVEKKELSYWEDYYIEKYNTIFPSGYNRRWNCNEKIRKEIQQRIKIETANENMFLNLFKAIEYSDVVFGWLFSHSFLEDGEYFIFKSDFSFTQLAKELNKSRVTISKRFSTLVQKNFISEVKINNREAYKIEKYKFFIGVSKDFINHFLRLPLIAKEEEALKTYLWLRLQFDLGNTDFSYIDLIENFGHSKGHNKIYNRYKIILNEFQNQKLIILDSQKNNRNKFGHFTKPFRLLDINENLL